MSNQVISSNGTGNPIVNNYLIALKKNSKLKVYFHSIRNLQSLFKIREIIKKNNIQITHIHFGGLNCFLALMIILKRTIKIVTFHGTDLHGGGNLKETGLKKYAKNKINKFFSLLSIKKADLVGIVSTSLQSYLPLKTSFFIDKLGVNDEIFNPEKYNQTESRLKLGLDLNKKYFLFSSISNSIIKRVDIAKSIIKNLNKNEYEILMMNRVKSVDVPYYLSACNYVLITSDKEGSPNIVREALLMNKIVFSVDCGDVKSQIKDSKFSIIISRDILVASRQILNQIKKLKKIKNNDREVYVKKISWTKLIDQKVDVYKNLLSKFGQ